MEAKRLAKLKHLRDDWERSTNRKIQANEIRRKVQGILSENQLALDARRARFHSYYVLKFCIFVCYRIFFLSFNLTGYPKSLSEPGVSCSTSMSLFCIATSLVFEQIK